jgi:hypothetical protein
MPLEIFRQPGNAAAPAFLEEFPAFGRGLDQLDPFITTVRVASDQSLPLQLLHET